MPQTYRARHGIDWPAEMPDELIDLTAGKKWRLIEARTGVRIPDPWVPMLRAATSLLDSSVFRVSQWTEEHFMDFVTRDGLVVWGPASSSKSNDFGLLAVLDWLVDPYDTVTLIGSTTKVDLRSRSWESVVRYHAALRNNRRGLSVPGRISRVGCSLTNLADEDSPESLGEKAGIQGRALNEDGRLQGAHLPFVRLIVDELAAISNHEAVGTAISNLRVGAVNFKFIGLANPESWENPSCQYCIPVGGTASVNVDTGCWESTRGYFVRHHDGLKSPCVVDPAKESEFPFLLTRKQYELSLADVDGNADAPRFWKMVRGFPVPNASSAPTVLPPSTAAAKKVSDPLPGVPFNVAAVAEGIDPAWSEGGDGARLARCRVVEIEGFPPILDFGGKTFPLAIDASSPRPVTEQLLAGVVSIKSSPDAAPLDMTAVDSSGNQGLADAIDMGMGLGCMHVNSSERASGLPIVPFEEQRAPGQSSVLRRRAANRGAEAWLVLAEFCAAGQVRGLPETVVKALTTRRWSVKKGTNDPEDPLRLERKEDFKRRVMRGRSPDDADACALASLIVKERCGLMPWGYLEPVSGLTPNEGMPAGVLTERHDGYTLGVESAGLETYDPGGGF